MLFLFWVGRFLSPIFRTLFSSTLGGRLRRLGAGCYPSQPRTFIRRLRDEANPSGLDGFYDSVPCALDVKCATFLYPTYSDKAAARLLRKLVLTPAEKFSRSSYEGSGDFFRHKEQE